MFVGNLLKESLMDKLINYFNKTDDMTITKGQDSYKRSLHSEKSPWRKKFTTGDFYHMLHNIGKEWERWEECNVNFYEANINELNLVAEKIRKESYNSIIKKNWDGVITPIKHYLGVNTSFKIKILKDKRIPGPFGDHHESVLGIYEDDKAEIFYKLIDKKYYTKKDEERQKRKMIENRIQREKEEKLIKEKERINQIIKEKNKILSNLEEGL